MRLIATFHCALWRVAGTGYCMAELELELELELEFGLSI